MRVDPKLATDSWLLLRFEKGRDQDAFAEVVRRHAPMVMATARRVLASREDAEEAYQATFLALARTATQTLAPIRKKQSVAGWLHRTAYRCAIDIHRKNTRWQNRISQAQEHPPERNQDVSPPDKQVGDVELRKVLDEEVCRLPGKYQVAIVLCDLEGMSQAAAARQLGIAQQTVNDRVSQGRRLLRDRLIRRGVGLTVASLATCVASATSDAANVSTSSWVTELTAIASRYAAGNSSIEVGLPQRVLDVANRTIQLARLTKLGAGIAASLAVVVTSVSLFLMASSFFNGTKDANVAFSFRDEFDQTTLAGWDTYHVGVGARLLGPDGCTMSADNGIVVAFKNESVADITLRTAVRIQAAQSTDAFAYLLVRSPDNRSYYGGVLADGTIRLGESFADLSQKYEESSTELDPTTHDVTIQLSAIDEHISLTAWRSEQAMPESPQLQLRDRTLSRGTYGFAFSAKHQGAATFRWMEWLPDPSAAKSTGGRLRQ